MMRFPRKQDFWRRDAAFVTCFMLIVIEQLYVVNISFNQSEAGIVFTLSKHQQST